MVTLLQLEKVSIELLHHWFTLCQKGNSVGSRFIKCLKCLCLHFQNKLLKLGVFLLILFAFLLHWYRAAVPLSVETRLVLSLKSLVTAEVVFKRHPLPLVVEVPVLNVLLMFFQQVFTFGLEVGDLGRGFVPKLVGNANINLKGLQVLFLRGYFWIILIFPTPNLKQIQ